MIDKIRFVIMGIFVAGLVFFVLLGAYPSFVGGILNLSEDGLNTWEIAYKNSAPFILGGFIILVVIIAFRSGGQK